MATPSTDDLRFAAEWLRQYDDTHDDGKLTAVAELVAAWLDEQANMKQLRDIAREHKLPVDKLRAKVKQCMKSVPQCSL